MPIYEYVCEKCGKLTDAWQKISDPPPERCEGCGAQGPLTRCMSRTSFVLKGGGWYSDLYSRPKKDGAKEGTAKEGTPAEKTKEKESGGKEKPAAASTAGASSTSAPAGSSTGSSSTGSSGGTTPK